MGRLAGSAPAVLLKPLLSAGAEPAAGLVPFSAAASACDAVCCSNSLHGRSGRVDGMPVHHDVHPRFMRVLQASS